MDDEEKHGRVLTAPRREVITSIVDRENKASVANIAADTKRSYRSVTQVVLKLHRDKFIEHTGYRLWGLTEKGKELAARIFVDQPKVKFRILTDFDPNLKHPIDETVKVAEEKIETGVVPEGTGHAPYIETEINWPLEFIKLANKLADALKCNTNE